MFLIDQARDFYGRFERPISSLSLLGGFVFDALTLKRVDTWWEITWVLAHLLIVGVFMILVHLKEHEDQDESNPHKAHFWYVNILQFFFGGTLSVYLVFYFRSADILVTWPFVAILAIAFIANERLKRHYMRLNFQLSLFFLSIYSFAIFLVPVILHKIGVWIFLLSGLVSLITIYIFIKLLIYLTKDKFIKSTELIWKVISTIFVLVNILYFTNLIPPIPLSLKDAGVYHSIEKNREGNYEVSYEDHGWRSYITMYEDFKIVPGSPVYVYSAIFSPKDLNITIIHEWQYYEEAQKKWLSESTIHLSVVGGRDGGFRTYSERKDLRAGKWRVRIKTELGQVIGHVRFTVTSSAIEPVLSTMIK